MNELTPGEKLRNLRKKYGLTQSDIAGNDLTRNLISEIENGKIRLTTRSAERIYFNIKAKIKNIDEDHVNWLIEDEVSLINKRAKRVLEKLKQINSLNELDNAKSLLHDIIYNKQVYYFIKYEIYLILADIDITKRKNYILKSIGIALMHKDYDMLIKAIYLVVKYDYSSKLYESVITESDIVLDFCEKEGLSSKNDDRINKIIFNRALAYKKLERFDECIESLNKLNYDISEEELLDISILRANCYIEKKQYEIAQGIYLDILGKSTKNENLKVVSRAYRNIAIIKLKLKQYENCEKYLKLAHDVGGSDWDRALTYYYSVLIYLKMNKIDKANLYFKSAIELLKKVQNVEYEVDIQVKMLEYCFNDCLNIEVVKWILKNMEMNMIKGRYLKNNLTNLFFIASSILKENFRLESEEIFNTGINLIKKV